MDTMDNRVWTVRQVERLFRLTERVKSRQSLLNAESRGEIPVAKRIQRGKQWIRNWTLDQLPYIGERFGFLKKPADQKIICVYTPKGGVLKTGFAGNFARVLALNGIKTLIVGLDPQCSITDFAIPSQEFESIDDMPPPLPGLYDFFYMNQPLENIIKNTSLPTLDIIPEGPDLHHLEEGFIAKPRREYIFQDNLIDKLTQYEVVIFDNAPGLTYLVKNALTASSILISPIGCDIETFKACKNNLSLIRRFKQAMNLEWKHFIQIPTRLDRANKLSPKIYAGYLRHYAEDTIPSPYSIRDSVLGQEARACRLSVLEYDPQSNLAQDYYEVIQYVWEKINS
jgi:chromosome partitioning protein